MQMTGSIHSHFFRGASNAALTANPTADSEIQPYYGVQEALMLSIQSCIGGAAVATGQKTTFNVQVIQEPAYIFGQTISAEDAPYFANGMNGDLGADTAWPSEAGWYPVNKIIPRDADLAAYHDGPGSDDADIVAHILYGPPLYVDQLRGKFFARLLEDATDAATDAWHEFEQSPINTFDPTKYYALVGLGLSQEDEPLEAVRVSCPSFDGLVPKALHMSPQQITRWYHPATRRQMAAGIFSGAESLTVEMWNGGTAQKPAAILEFIELDNEYALNMQGSKQVVPNKLPPMTMSRKPSAQMALGLLGGLVR